MLKKCNDTGFHGMIFCFILPYAMNNDDASIFTKVDILILKARSRANAHKTLRLVRYIYYQGG